MIVMVSCLLTGEDVANEGDMLWFPTGEVTAARNGPAAPATCS